MQRGLSIRFFSVMQMFAAFTTPVTALPHDTLRKVPHASFAAVQDDIADGDDHVVRTENSFAGFPS